MHETARMSRIEALATCARISIASAGSRRPSWRAFQVTPLDVAHGYKEDVLGRPSLVDRDDVRVVDRCC